MITIHSLKNYSGNMLFQAFREAFRDYEMQLDRQGLERMLRRRGFDPALSFGAFDNGKLVAFTFNGTGRFQDQGTAYDTGTGTISAYRGRGLAKEIFNHSIPHLKKAGIRQYLLEVLQHNTGAVALYRKLGFEVTREFYYYKGRAVRPVSNRGLLAKGYDIETIPAEKIIELPDFSDFHPSWQNSRQSIQRGLDQFGSLAATMNGKTVGCCIFERSTADITEMAVSPEHRRKGIGSSLLAKALDACTTDDMQVINIPVDAAGAAGFLASCGLRPTGKQFEMIRRL